MDRPKCKICTARHYAHEPHQFPQPEGGVYGLRNTVDVPLKAEPVEVTIEAPKTKNAAFHFHSPGPKYGRPEGEILRTSISEDIAKRLAARDLESPKEAGAKFDRNAYQREYMRKRRGSKLAKP